MNAAGNKRSIIRATLFGLLAITSATACRKAPFQAKDATVVASLNLAQDMIGTWVHVGRPGQMSEIPDVGQRLKFRTGRHWALTRADPSGLVVEHFGGTYTLTNNEYVETQDYGDETWMSDNGKSFKFIVKVEGDTMTQVGVGNPYTEVWKRVK